MVKRVLQLVGTASALVGGAAFSEFRSSRVSGSHSIAPSSAGAAGGADRGTSRQRQRPRSSSFGVSSGSSLGSSSLLLPLHMMAPKHGFFSSIQEEHGGHILNSRGSDKRGGSDSHHHPSLLSAVSIESSFDFDLMNSMLSSYDDTATVTAKPPSFGFPQSSATSASRSSASETDASWLDSYFFPVASAVLLITGNTIGASCLVLPQVAAGPGLLPSAGLFIAAYIFNWVSGVTLAEVAIRQREASLEHGNGSDVPSSFKEFAQENLKSNTAATAISALSLFVNACMLSFDFSRFGAIGHAMIPGVEMQHIQFAWATGLLALVTTQSGNGGHLGKVASALVTMLFVSFGSLLLPGMAAVQDPLTTILQPGTFGIDGGDLMSSVGHAAPVILMSLVYQNIVPSITKMLGYDRCKTVAAITFGSAIPLALFLAFVYASLGGGIDAASLINGLSSGGGGAGLLLTVFSLSTIAGSSLGSILSLSEELDTYIKPLLNNDNNNEKKKELMDNDTTHQDGFQLPSVLASVALPLAAAVALQGGDDITSALQWAGSFGTPLLYGVLPAVMAWNQRQQQSNAAVIESNLQAQQQQERRQPTVVPEPLMPTASVGALGLLSTSFVGQELLSFLPHTI